MHVLIAGGGIAGTVAAMALQQIGVSSTILEAHAATDGEVGSYLTITANGLTALDMIGARDVATAAGFPTHRNVLWNQAGHRLATIPLDSRLPGSPSARTIKRSQVVRALQEEAQRRGIVVEFGRRVRDAAITADGRVHVDLLDGTAADGDLLVGADGVHSAVRRIIDPAAPAGRYVGLTNFGGMTAGAAADIEPGAWHLIFGRRAFFGYQATPRGDVVWFANVPRGAITPEERARTTEGAWRQQLTALFADDAGSAVALIEAGHLELAADNTHDLGHVPTWRRGPMLLVGDAAHAPAPTSGQGASMAIEDGITLAAALREHAGVGEALTAYEAARRERVERIVAYGARGSSAKVPGPFGRLARDVVLRMLFRYVITEKSLAWMYDYRTSAGPLTGPPARA